MIMEGDFDRAILVLGSWKHLYMQGNAKFIFPLDIFIFQYSNGVFGDWNPDIFLA